MAIILDGTAGITTPDITSTTSTLGTLTQALNLGSTGQIVFPATQSASANANTLDDYEEGTWTPSFTCTGTITTQSGSGRYTKVGDTVILTGTVTVAVWGSVSGSVTVNGMPFTTADKFTASGVETAVNGKACVGREVSTGATSFTFMYYDNSALANTQGNGTNFIFSATYRTTQ